MRETVKYRMYGLVPYNISPIQQGIQFGHAVVEYGLEYGQGHADDPYLQWARNDKTFIILNGGTTNRNEDHWGTLNQSVLELERLRVQYSSFYEPDLGDQLTAVVFLVDERVWDKEKYPEYDELLHGSYTEKPNHDFDLFGDDADQILGIREFLSNYRLA